MPSSNFSIPTPNWQTNTIKHYFRLPLILGALALILFHTIYLVFFVPTDHIDYEWQEDNIFLIVTQIPPDAPSASQLQLGDVILAIDDLPATRHIWKPLYTPGKSTYVYTIKRGADIFTKNIIVSTPDVEETVFRLVSGVVGLLMWLLATLVILFATPQNDAAWQLGLTTLGLAVILSASEAAQYGVPVSWISSYPFMPLISVALAQIAVLPHSGENTDRRRKPFRFFYFLAFLIGILALIELIILYPKNISLSTYSVLSFYELIYLCLGIGGAAHLIILFWRFLYIPSSYFRQQSGIVLIITASALLPGLFLTIFPLLLFNKTVLPWNLSIAFLVLIPAGYGFVIYRRNYLELDIFATKTLTHLIVALTLVISFSLGELIIEDIPQIGGFTTAVRCFVFNSNSIDHTLYE